MDKCYNCGKFGHRQYNCPEQSSHLKRCYDCNEYVTSIDHHRPTCTKSKYAKSLLTSPSMITTSNNKKSDYKDFYFLLDVSGSMDGNKLATAKICTQDIVARMNPLDRMAIVTFDSSAFFKLKPRPVEQIMCKNELNGILDRIFAHGQTAIYDAIHLAVSQLKDKSQPTIMLVLTDGEDNSSKYTYAQITEMLKEYPNISLSIIHIDEHSKPNVNYKDLCLQNRGQYLVIKEELIKVTVEHIFNVYYVSV